VVKVREGLAKNDYRDPGPYKHPQGTVAYAFSGDAGQAPRAPMQPLTRAPAVEFDVVKPGSKTRSTHEH
jgi:hypothetical protein